MLGRVVFSPIKNGENFFIYRLGGIVDRFNKPDPTKPLLSNYTDGNIFAIGRGGIDWSWGHGFAAV